MTVNPAVGNQPEEMKPRILSVIKSLAYHVVRCQLPVDDRFVDSGEILVNNSTGSEIEMTHLRIPHLPIRQAYIHTTRAQTAQGIFLIETIVKWRLRQERRIAISLRGFTPVRINPPSIPNK
jgi:hypothetical protein